MPSAVALRHVPFEGLGSLHQLLNEHGYDITYLDAGIDTPDSGLLKHADLLIVMGGPISANDEHDYPFLAAERGAIEMRLQTMRPTLGICLGAQIIARAAGARIGAATQKEIGWSTLELTAAGHKSCLRHLQDTDVLHWHGETFTLPTTGEHLAASTACTNQAFGIGSHTLALQFHIEVTAESLEGWYIGHSLELAQASIDVTELRLLGQHKSRILQPAAHACMNEWLDGLNMTRGNRK